MNNRLGLLDYWRGWAILMVVLDHLFVWLGLNLEYPSLHQLFIYSVTPLIFLAGFTFALSYLKRPLLFVPVGKKLFLKSLSLNIYRYGLYFYHKSKKIIGAYALGLLLIFLYQKQLSWSFYWQNFFTFPHQFYFILIYIQLLLLAPFLAWLYEKVFLIQSQKKKYYYLLILISIIFLFSLWGQHLPLPLEKIYLPGRLLFGGIQLFVFSLGSLSAFLWQKKKNLGKILFTWQFNLSLTLILGNYLFFSGNLFHIFHHPPNFYTLIYCLALTSLFFLFYHLCQKLKLVFINQIFIYFGQYSLAIFIYHGFLMEEILKINLWEILNQPLAIQILFLSALSILGSILITQILTLIQHLMVIFCQKFSKRKLIFCFLFLFYFSSGQIIQAGTNIFLQEQPITILSTGDLMLGRSVNYLGLKKNNYAWSLEAIAPFLTQFDYIVANLETPITNNCEVTNEGMKFCAHPLSAQALKNHHFGLLTLANNHIYDQGQEGLTQTQAILQNQALDSLIEGEFKTKKIENTNFGFLAFDDTLKDVALNSFAHQIKMAKKQCDVLFVALHFGHEYRYHPVERQIDLAHSAIENGADIVLGNHSHWLGPIEKYQHGVIIYSHGNFIFDQMWSEETKSGVLIAWTFAEKKLTQVEIYPNYITNYGQANLVHQAPQGEKIIAKMYELSQWGKIINNILTIKISGL